MKRRTFTLALAIVVVLVASGLAAPRARAQPAPTLSILSPADNAVIGNGTPVAVIFSVSNFNLTNPGSGSTSPDVGHVDVLVDGGLVAKASTNTVLLPLASGSHTILLRLVSDNGSALIPDVTASVTVTVTRGPAGGSPGLSIAFPADGALLGTDLTISIRVTDFALVPLGSPPDVPGEGHIHAFVDGNFYAELTNEQPVHFSLQDGSHNVTFQLVDSGHNPLSPDVTASAHFSVKALIGRVIPLDLTPYFAGVNILLGLAILAAFYRKLEV